jgi:transcriptional regulator with XRE-family HTH domain
MSSPPSWQAVLQRIIQTPAERQRLATALGVSVMTLIRWTNGSYRPQKPHLTRLVQVIPPQYRAELLEALESDFPDIHSWLHEEPPEQIPPDFFVQVLNARATIIETLRFWHITDMVLKQSLAQLDPNRLGMSITLVQCMPPSQGGKIRSLRERMGKGTLPWTADLEHLSSFLGIETLAGYVVQYQRPASIEDLSRDNLLPAYQSEYEVSAAANPIWLDGRIAGCLLASSTQIGYFSQHRLALLSTFSDVISLAFDKNDFYRPDCIELSVMPPPDKQRPHLAKFRQRVTQVLVDAAQNKHHLTNTQAEQIVWYELEETLLNTP